MATSPISRRRRSILRWLPALFFVILIFTFSSIPGDKVGETYDRLDRMAQPLATPSATIPATPSARPPAATVTAGVTPAAPKATASATALPISSVLRKIPVFSSLDFLKAGHAIGYFCLGWTVLYALGLQLRWSPGIALLLCSLYAVSDELHQGFVPGRTPSARDVLLDMLAALAGMLLLFALLKSLARMRALFRQGPAPVG